MYLDDSVLPVLSNAFLKLTLVLDPGCLVLD